MIINELQQAFHRIGTFSIQSGKRRHTKTAVADAFFFEYLKSLIDNCFHDAAWGVFSVSGNICHVSVFAEKWDEYDESNHFAIGI